MLPYRIPDSFLASRRDTTIGLFQETVPLCPPVPFLTWDSCAPLSSMRITARCGNAWRMPRDGKRYTGNGAMARRLDVRERPED